jgi:hypothetical protein
MAVSKEYPNKDPALKSHQREAHANILAQPISSATEPHSLLLVEYPEISGVRRFNAEKFEFDYRSVDLVFMAHMRDFFDMIGSKKDIDDLFEG